jgi:FKBP12-rapamycin complex-associated protein
VRCLEIAMTQADAPPEVTQALLNLAEFMEHEDKPLPLENRTLGEYATKNNAFAKALHYKELEFFTDPSPSVIEALLEINTKLQQNDAALGTLTMATDQFGTTKHEEWYIKLNRWQGALEAYDERLSKEPGNVEVVVGKMRCLHALGEWEKLSAYVEQYWDDARMDRKRIAPMAAAAAWSMNEWAGLSQYLTEWTEDSADRQFHEAIYLIHDNNFLKAAACIDRAREHLDVEFTRAIENYGRSYKYVLSGVMCAPADAASSVMVRAQMLSELEEIIRYRQSADQPERQATMRRTWMKR